jgi:hypothetical protein
MSHGGHRSQLLNYIRDIDIICTFSNRKDVYWGGEDLDGSLIFPILVLVESSFYSPLLLKCHNSLVNSRHTHNVTRHKEFPICCTNDLSLLLWHT